MIKKTALWILWTFIKGFKIIGISILMLGFMAGLIGIIIILVWWGIKNKEYLILSSIIVNCIFIYGLIYRVVWNLKLPEPLRRL